jgi:hypothetical protein
MSKMTKPLAILALVAVLGPAHAEPIDTPPATTDS